MDDGVVPDHAHRKHPSPLYLPSPRIDQLAAAGLKLSCVSDHQPLQRFFVSEPATGCVAGTGAGVSRDIPHPSE